MKQLKFLAYDRLEKKVVRVFKLDHSQWWVGTGYLPGEGERNSFKNEPTDRHMLMEYIRIDDKNGKEIYTGFIVDVELHETKPSVMKERFVVGYDETKVRYVLIDEYGTSYGFGNSNVIEVVGDIYTNRDLLTSEAWRALTMEDFPEPKVYEKDENELPTANHPNFSVGFIPLGSLGEAPDSFNFVKELGELLFGSLEVPKQTMTGKPGTIPFKTKIYKFPSVENKNITEAAEMAMYNRADGIKAQKEFCTKNGLPLFAPEDGQCFNCRKNIYLQIEEKNAYSVERAGEFHITGCPHCSKSFCE
jgi:hypothetical protein